MKTLIIPLILLVVLISGCTQQTQEITDVKQEAINLCVNLCKKISASIGVPGLKNGPCLSIIKPDWNINDWVCDVAHSPRQDVDNLPENQCSAYREGTAKHFVEVDPNCNLIRAV